MGTRRVPAAPFAVCYGDDAPNAENAAFIAAAREGWPAALDDNDRLSKLNEQLQAQVDRLTAQATIDAQTLEARALVIAEQAAQIEALTTFRPMDTAPMDGTRVNVLLPKGEVLSAYWKADFECVPNPRWEEEDQLSMIDVGAWTDDAVQSFGYEETCSYEPIGWLPLPATPAPAPPDSLAAQ